MDRFPECAGALSVYDPDLKDPAPSAFHQILAYQILHLARLKRVQIQRPVNGKLDRLGLVLLLRHSL